MIIYNAIITISDCNIWKLKSLCHQNQTKYMYMSIYVYECIKLIKKIVLIR